MSQRCAPPPLFLLLRESSAPLVAVRAMLAVLTILLLLLLPPPPWPQSRHLASVGCRVVLAARSMPAMEKIVAEIKAAGGEAAAVNSEALPLRRTRRRLSPLPRPRLGRSTSTCLQMVGASITIQMEPPLLHKMDLARGALANDRRQLQARV